MPFDIKPYTSTHLDAVLSLSKRAWTPVFEKLHPAVQPYVYDAFYPDGWWPRQEADITALLKEDETAVWVALEGGRVHGFVGIRLHPKDQMGEVYIIAVDPDYQKRGIGRALLDTALAQMKHAGMAMVMVETGGDPGHAPSRAAYESAGFERWPVARYFRKL